MTPLETTRKDVIGRIGELVSRAEAIADPAARGIAVDLLQAVMELHTGALDRMLEIVSASSCPEAVDLLAADDLVSSVLVLHGLHPEDLETRLERAFERLRRYFDVRGASISLVQLGASYVHLRFHSSRPGAGVAARQAIEDTIYEAAPDLESLIIDGLDEQGDSGFVPLSSLLVAQKA